MATPCRKCGATKTEAVHHGAVYGLAKGLGYRLRVCSRCRRYRLLHLHEDPDEPLVRDASGNFVPQSLPPGAALPVRPSGGCPHCGSTDYRRSRRHWHERLYGRSPMARCQRCWKRFPMPPYAV